MGGNFINLQESKISHQVIDIRCLFAIRFLPTLRVYRGRVIVLPHRSSFHYRILPPTLRFGNFFLKPFTLAFKRGHIAPLFSLSELICSARAARRFPRPFASRAGREFAIAFYFSGAAPRACCDRAADLEKRGLQTSGKGGHHKSFMWTTALSANFRQLE